MSDSSTSPADKNADTTKPTNPTPNARSHYDKKAVALEKQFVERFKKDDRVQVSSGRGVGPTIYTIESIKDGIVTLLDDLGGRTTARESKLRKVN